MGKFFNRAFLAVLLAALLVVPGWVALRSHRETSAYYENRTLAEPPALTWTGLADGSFGSAFESWYSDHFPGRATLLKMDTKVQMDALKRPVVNDTVVTESTLLPFMAYEEQPPEEYARQAVDIAEDLQKLDAHIRANGGSFYYVGIPEQRVYFGENYPDFLASHAGEYQTADDAFAAALADQNVRFLDMRQVYEALGHPAEYYSAVDHHYNYYGAYAAYRAILDMLAGDGWQLPVLTEEDLDFVELPNPYIGSRNRKLYNLWPNGEKAVMCVQKAPVPFARTDNGQPSEKPLFVLPAADYLPTTYNLYMGGDFGETVLETGRPELPDVLIFGDSFTNALETLLYASFDETRILDLRHYTDKSLKDYIAEYRPDLVLCVQNDTFYYTATGNGAVWDTFS